MTPDTGARLSHVVVPITEPVKRFRYEYQEGVGLVRTAHEEKGGYMVYFPRGHAIRVRNKKMLRHYGLLGDPKLVSMDGLFDRTTALGQLMLAQDDKRRQEAFASMEKKVIQLATRLSGPMILTADTTLGADEPEDDDDD